MAIQLEGRIQFDYESMPLGLIEWKEGGAALTFYSVGAARQFFRGYRRSAPLRARMQQIAQLHQHMALPFHIYIGERMVGSLAGRPNLLSKLFNARPFRLHWSALWVFVLGSDQRDT